VAAGELLVAECGVVGHRSLELEEEVEQAERENGHEDHQRHGEGLLARQVHVDVHVFEEVPLGEPLAQKETLQTLHEHLERAHHLLRYHEHHEQQVQTKLVAQEGEYLVEGVGPEPKAAAVDHDLAALEPALRMQQPVEHVHQVAHHEAHADAPEDDAGRNLERLDENHELLHQVVSADVEHV